MTKTFEGARNFPSAADDKALAERSQAHEALLASPAYRLAYDDPDLMLRDELRPMRLMLELSKPELLMAEHGIEHTVVLFGSARICDPHIAEMTLQELRSSELQESARNEQYLQALRAAERAVELAQYYAQARELARMVSERSRDFALNGFACLHVMTGGGPGIMEAANRGALDASGKTVGLNIVLPHEQHPNRYITPDLCFRFHYFAVRKMHFLMRARAVVVFPGGYGTLDELFETLTLLQTGKIRPLPLILIGESFWRRLINFDFLLEQGLISRSDLQLFKFAESAEEAWQLIATQLANGYESTV